MNGMRSIDAATPLLSQIHQNQREIDKTPTSSTLPYENLNKLNLVATPPQPLPPTPQTQRELTPFGQASFRHREAYRPLGEQMYQERNYVS
jgi:hypothetical protein